MTEYDYQNQNQPFGKQDLEANIGVNFSQEMRNGFIKKVYGILTAQLFITTAFIGLSFLQSVRDFAIFSNVAVILAYVCLGVILCVLISLYCCRHFARKVPTNYILLGVFTLCESYCLLFISSYYDRIIVIIAIFGTAGITAALTVYACTTKTDFTFLGSFLFCGVFLLCFGGIFCGIFWHSYRYNLLYCILGLLLYSVYLIYDTQLIVGKMGVEFETDDYIIAAIQVYIDIIQIFLFLLRLLGSK